MESQLPESASLSDSQENPLLRRCTLALSVQELEKAREAYLRKCARKAKMPGFRPGKAPPHLIEQEYGAEAREEALTELLDQSWKAYAGQFNVASVLDMEETPSPDPEKRLFVATFEVFPEFDLADLSQISIVRPVVEITEEDINLHLDDMRMNQGEDVEVERGAQIDDYVTLSYSMTLDGAPLPDEDAEEIEITLGEQEDWKAFDEEIVGLKAGESKDFDFIYPESEPDLAGKTVRVHATVSKVEVWKSAELDADFARENGIDDGDLDALRARIKKELEEESAKLAWLKTKNNVLDALQEAHTAFAVPESLVQEKTQEQVDEVMARLTQEGKKPNSPQPDLSDDDRESIAEEIRQEIRLALILEKVGALENVQILAKASSSEALVRENRIIQRILDKAQVVDEPNSHGTLEDWYFDFRYR
ncbi:MAG: trigger factor [Azoarcus sp.]|nr:trigger factor [Azoarcus sp.]